MIETSLWQTATQLQRYLESIGQAFCFIGGVAVQRWGEPRVTRDVDATLLVPFGSEQQVATKILTRYQSRIDNPIAFAIQARILLLQDLSGNQIDLSIGGMPFEERMLTRSTAWDVAGHGSITTCSAEDLINLKAFASRPQDWIDAQNVIIRQADRLDRALIRSELEVLANLKEEPEIMTHLEVLFAKHPPLVQ